MSEELDDIGAQTAAMMKTMLQLATLVALRTRERGQKEAEARAKVTETRMKEARELQVREARDMKAKDPRNTEMALLVEKAAPVKGISLDKDRAMAMSTAAASPAAGSAPKVVAPTIRFDSPERRTAVAAHLNKLGIAPELATVRMLIEVGQGKSVEESARTRAEQAPAIRRAREQEIARGIDRTR